MGMKKSWDTVVTGLQLPVSLENEELLLNEVTPLIFLWVWTEIIHINILYYNHIIIKNHFDKEESDYY